MANLKEFLLVVASHWVWLVMALVAFLACQFVEFGDNRKVVPALVIIGIGCIIMALYLAVNDQLTALNQSLSPR